MKKRTTLLSLLFTAILCLGLASCDKRLTNSSGIAYSEGSTEETATVDFSNNGTTAQQTNSDPQQTEDLSGISTETQNIKQTTVVITTVTPDTTKHQATTIPTATTQQTTSAPVTTTLPIGTMSPSTTVVTEPEPPTTSIITDSEDDDFESAVIRSVNKHRAEQGLSELSYSPELSAAADIRAKELVSSFSNIRPDGSLCITVDPLVKGENIEKGYATPELVMEAWMNSDGHKKNILTKQYTIIGVGCYYDSASDTYYWVQLFG